MDIERLYRMHKLIQQESTGTPDEFAERFHVKRRQLFYLLEELKSYGAVVKYHPLKSSYYYLEDFDFFEKIGMVSLSGKENKRFLQKIIENFLKCSDDCIEDI
ncbi:hypothetical protein FACS1894174_03160 [Bacteroidia bacterium]|nr:hypothetical protein FACS1894174_03160 [Bacteroidia bacterium]